MIKISKEEQAGGRAVELKIEGKVCGQWAEELKHICQNILSGPVDRLILNFSSVTSIDQEGLKLLKKVDCPRIQITGLNMFLRDRIAGTKLKQCIIDSEVTKR